MSWNKTSIASSASLNAIARKFDPEERLTGSHHLRAKKNEKGEIVIYEKHFSATKFLASMGNKEARAQIREQRQLAHDLLVEKVNTECNFTAEDIQLRGHAPLRGRVVKPMLAHAVVAAAAKEMGLNAHAMDNEMKQLVCQLARDHVYAMPSVATASDRVYAAKVFIAQKLVEDLLTYYFKDQPVDLLTVKLKDLQALCMKLPFTPLGRQVDMDVVAGLFSLLKTREQPFVDALLKHVAQCKQNRLDKLALNQSKP